MKEMKAVENQNPNQKITKILLKPDFNESPIKKILVCPHESKLNQDNISEFFAGESLEEFLNKYFKR